MMERARLDAGVLAILQAEAAVRYAVGPLPLNFYAETTIPYLV